MFSSVWKKRFVHFQTAMDIVDIILCDSILTVYIMSLTIWNDMFKSLSSVTFIYLFICLVVFLVFLSLPAINLTLWTEDKKNH